VRDVEIVLDKPRTLRFTLGALRDLQRVSGQPLHQFVATMGEVSIDHLLWTIWAGLKHAWPKLTVEQTQPLIEKYLENGGTLPELMATVNEAFLQCGLFGAPAGEEPENPPGPAPTPA
jgi:hypothetical protein